MATVASAAGQVSVADGGLIRCMPCVVVFVNGA
jgi:hypothetical protein